MQCRGPKQKSKWDILNKCLLMYSKRYKFKAMPASIPFDAPIEVTLKYAFQPNTVQGHLKRLFTVFRRNGILYDLQLDFNGIGGYLSWWTTHWGIIGKLKKDFGTELNKAEVDKDEPRKLLFCENAFDLTNPEDAMSLYYMTSSRYYGMRGRHEVSFVQRC